jgi:hypothetical protein
VLVIVVKHKEEVVDPVEKMHALHELCSSMGCMQWCWHELSVSKSTIHIVSRVFKQKHIKPDENVATRVPGSLTLYFRNKGPCLHLRVCNELTEHPYWETRINSEVTIFLNLGFLAKSQGTCVGCLAHNLSLGSE